MRGEAPTSSVAMLTNLLTLRTYVACPVPLPQAFFLTMLFAPTVQPSTTPRFGPSATTTSSSAEPALLRLQVGYDYHMCI
jgi:hypothetical protein